MIGISIASKREWEATLDYYHKKYSDCTKYSLGEYFKIKLNEKDVLFYHGGVRKVMASASTQYMIDHFQLEKILVIGTCAGIDDQYKTLDIFLPSKAVQYDCTIKEIEPFIKEKFIVDIDLSKYQFKFNTGTIGTADKAVVMWNDYLELKSNHITIADTESAAIAYICKLNHIECIIVKGISDFPTNEENAYHNQVEMFVNNIPIIMNTIYDNYLSKLM